MAFSVDRAFFISFLEETVQKTHTDFTSTLDVLSDPVPDTAFDAIKLICTRACLLLLGDASPQLKRKDDRNFVVVTKAPDFYSPYRYNEAVYKQKTQKVSAYPNIDAQNVCRRYPGCFPKMQPKTKCVYS